MFPSVPKNGLIINDIGLYVATYNAKNEFLVANNTLQLLCLIILCEATASVESLKSFEISDTF